MAFCGSLRSNVPWFPPFHGSHCSHCSMVPTVPTVPQFPPFQCSWFHGSHRSWFLLFPLFHGSTVPTVPWFPPLHSSLRYMGCSMPQFSLFHGSIRPDPILSCHGLNFHGSLRSCSMRGSNCPVSPGIMHALGYCDSQCFLLYMLRYNSINFLDMSHKY